jgi:hypothetical protein
VKTEMRKLAYFFVLLLLVAPTVSLGATLTHSGKALTSTSLDVSEWSVSAGTNGAFFGLAGGSLGGTVTLALALEEFGVDMQSPHENLVLMSGGLLNIGVTRGNNVLDTIQQSIGGANVSVSVNSILTGVAPLASGEGICQGEGCDATLAFVLATNPAFTVLNSYPVAQMLLVREALGAALNSTYAGLGVASNGAIIQMLNAGVAEYSPHQNVGNFAGAALKFNTALISNSSSLITIQQQIGVANVQAAINSIVVGSATLSKGELLIPQ